MFYNIDPQPIPGPPVPSEPEIDIPSEDPEIERNPDQDPNIQPTPDSPEITPEPHDPEIEPDVSPDPEIERNPQIHPGY